MMQNKKKLEHMLFTDVAYFLNIKNVVVKHVSFSEYGESVTLLAVASYKENIIYVNADIADDITDITYINALAHELRHLWQYNNIKTNPDIAKCFDNHKRSIDVGVEAYNSQFLELDANAFAVFFLEGLGYRPTLDTFSDDLRKKTYERTKEIKQEFVERGLIKLNTDK